MDYDEVRAKVDGIPHMDAAHGKVIYDHVRAVRPAAILELGTANGVSAAYMAAALEANGTGRITSIDRDVADYQPGPVHVLGSVQLQHRVDLIRVPDSSYDWWLRTRVRERSDGAGNCEPFYDFIFLDGAHELTIDGLAVVLAEKLLKPGGWLLLDDLDWSFSQSESQASPPLPLSAAERDTPAMREVFDLIVRQNPVFTEFRDQDEHWGWAKKAPGQPRRLSLESSESVQTMLLRKTRHAVREIRSRRA